MSGVQMFLGSKCPWGPNVSGVQMSPGSKCPWGPNVLGVQVSPGSKCLWGPTVSEPIFFYQNNILKPLQCQKNWRHPGREVDIEALKEWSLALMHPRRKFSLEASRKGSWNEAFKEWNLVLRDPRSKFGFFNRIILLEIVFLSPSWCEESKIVLGFRIIS